MYSQENVANCVGGYTFSGNLIPKNVAVPENVADTYTQREMYSHIARKYSRCWPKVKCIAKSPENV